MRVLVCGGGVIGTTIAYFLACRGVEAVVIEGTGVACAASGKSGGFLALDWCDGTPLQSLARRSFALHAHLADTIGDHWGYRRLDTYGGAIGARPAIHRGSADTSAHGWLSDDVRVAGQLGTPRTTAQVDPAAFTTAMMRAAEMRGAILRSGRVTGLMQDRTGPRLRGVEVDGEEVTGDAVVIAMGPWSVLAARWLPLPAVFGLKGHSLVFDTATRVPAQSMFLEYRDETGEVLAPEVFPRRDGTTYVCAISSDSPLPVAPPDVVPDRGAMDRLQDLCRRISPALDPAMILKRQACFRPVTQDGLPLVGRVPNIANAFVATGHSVWGILNAPATGEAMSELIVDGAARAVDLSPFDPARLPPLDPSRLRSMM